MLEFKELQLQNFKSFVQPTTVQLRRDAGLHFITGQNFENEALGANAVGKSTIFDGLVFALFGKTPRNLKAKDVCSWTQEGGTRVELFFEIDGYEYHLVRGWRPNVLQLNERTVQQEEVEQTIGVNFNEALHMLGMGQWSRVFLDLGPTDKLNLMSSILRLDTWQRFAEIAKEEVKSLDDDIEDLRHKVTSYQASAKQLASSAEENQKRIEEYENKRNQDLEQLQKDIEDYRKFYQRSKDKYEEYKQQAEAEKEALPAIQERLSGLQEAYERKKGKLNDTKLELTDLERQLNNLEKEASRIKELKGAECPKCKQEVGEEHVAECINQLDEQYNDLSSQADQCDETIDQLNDDLSRLKRQIQKVKDEEQQVWGRYEEVMKLANKKDKEASQCEYHLNRLLSDYEKTQEQNNPYQEIADDEIAKSKDYYAYAENAKKEADKLEQERELYAYWIDGAKDIRLYVIEKAIVDLELEVNNALSQLGLGDWSIKFDVARETQSGNISTGFTTFIRSPHNEEAVPWNAWSGGETQRLRIAGAMGLASLISSRRGINFNVEFYDEPTRGLGGEGVHELLSLLQERGKRVSKSVYIIDHRSHDFAGFGSVLNVTKDSSGSKLEDSDGNV